MAETNLLPALHIGDLEVRPPIIQGGMGVRVSRANLASAVANEGAVGVIAAVGLGGFELRPKNDYIETNAQALRDEIKKAKALTNGILGVNIMCALTDYESLVSAAVESGIDVIISGAGLPTRLPHLAKGTNVKLVPIVSSIKAMKSICKYWKLNYDRLPDAVVVEGPLAGGHLGFTYDDMVNNKFHNLETIVAQVVEFANSFIPPIPVIAAGGVFDGKDIARMFHLGASGVQMASRFVCTYECDAHEDFKRAWLDAREEDLVIIRSPVGLPGRALKNKFVERVFKGETIPFSCRYHCLKSCDFKTAPFCIAKALVNAVEGNIDNGLLFAGANAYRCNEIISVKTLINQLVMETAQNLQKRQNL